MWAHIKAELKKLLTLQLLTKAVEELLNYLKSKQA